MDEELLTAFEEATVIEEWGATKSPDWTPAGSFAHPTAVVNSLLAS